jgi:uncharacterized protein involved in exopolysaccharide biosynthesis
MASFRSRSFSEYLQIIWRRKLLIFLITAGMLISTFFVISRLPDVYESRATVVVASQQNDRQSVNAQVAAATEQITSRAFLEPIVERYKPYSGRGGSVDASIERMRQDIKVTTMYRSDFPERLNIAYRHTDPAMAKAVATDLTSVLDQVNGTIEKQTAEEASSVAAQIAEIENRLRDMGKLNAASAARRSAAGRASGEMSAIRAQRIAAASSIETLGDKKFALEQQIAEQKRQIAEQQKIVKMAPSDARTSSSYGVLLVRKAELEAQIKEYASQYTDKNPKVIQARSQLAEINHQIAQLSAGGDQSQGPVSSAEARELRAMMRELSRMETELAVTQRELERKKNSAPGVSSSASVAAPLPVVASSVGGEPALESKLDYETLSRRYNSLLDRQEQLAKAQVVMAGLNPGIFQIIDAPTQPRAPVGPNRLKYQLFALGLALGVALLVAFAIEVPRLYSITDDRDVEYYLGVPVIAFIPETVAPPRAGQGRRLLLSRTVGALAVSALISVVLLLLNFL